MDCVTYTILKVDAEVGKVKRDIVLSVENLHTSFQVGKQSIEVVKGVSFEVHRGKTLAIVGESGCGKSVTIHSVMRLLPPQGRITEGKVTYYTADGQALELTKYAPFGKEMRAVRGGEIGIIFQDPMASLNPVYTVGDQIIENLRQHEKISKKEALERAIVMLQRLGIPDAARRVHDYPHQFSGGMKQRVMIAIAMICNPQILIADEPTTALDVTIQAQIMELMRELQETGNKSIILNTHNMGLVAEMAHYIAVMYLGRVVEYGTAEQIFEDSRHPYTTALLKSVPVLGMQQDRMYTIRGATPSPDEVKEGCEFASRCDYATEGCRRGVIAEHMVDDGHMVRCNLVVEGIRRDSIQSGV